MNKNKIDLLKKTVREWSDGEGANISVESFKQEVDLLYKKTGKNNFSRILEVGSGSGLFGVYLVLSGLTKELLGIDPSFSKKNDDNEFEIENLINVLGLNDKVIFKPETIEEFLEKNNFQEYYDLVYFRQSLHHIYERKGNLFEDKKIIDDFISIKKLIKEGGLVCILEADRPSCFNRFLHDSYRRLRGSGKMEWDSKRTKGEWVNILNQAGFKDIKSSRMPLNIFSSHKLGKHLGNLFSYTFLITGAKK
jgi:hypothetical protein